jgi:hypothetical protein
MNVEQVAAATQGEQVDGAFTEYLSVPTDDSEPVAHSKGRKFTRFLILCVCAWSLIETWVEIGTATDNLRIAALFVAKLIWLLIGGAAIFNIRAGRAVFASLCGVSVLAVASALPSMYVISETIFILLLIEFLLKISCLIALCGKYIVD